MKTAVEWLIETIDEFYGYEVSARMINQIKQAKQMEKGHLYNFYMQGGVDAIMEADRNVEQYYNETFKPD